MYRNITGVNAYKEPMMISPAAHFSMGGLWVDYDLMTSIQGLFAIGEANFSDHGANRLGANSLLQAGVDRMSTRLNSSHVKISYAVFCLKKKNKNNQFIQ